MRKYLFYLAILTIGLCSCTSKGNAQKEMSYYKEIKVKADTAHTYCKSAGLNEDFCILIDMNIHSGKNRFFMWDFAKDTVTHSGLCCHGYGEGSTEQTPEFSNTPGSYCSSLGKYKIGIRSYSQYGINVHYKLHGLEKSNNNAFRRVIVLHSHNPVPESEIYPTYLPLGYSQGCPVISNELMRVVDVKLKNVKKETLLWIY